MGFLDFCKDYRPRNTLTMKCLVTVICVSLIYTAYCSHNGETFFGNAENKDLKDACSGDSCKNDHKSMTENPSAEINVIITFTNAEGNMNLQNKFTVTVSSLFHHSTVPLAMHIIGDTRSREIAENIMKNNAGEAKYRMVDLDVDKLAKALDDIVKPMQKHFSYKTGAYYNHALFFLSIAIHKVMPESMEKVIMMDADLKFTDDIKKLHDRFRLFKKDNVIGIARELQPVYRHAFWKYRGENPGTRVGEPPPNGLTGFNSGVMLLNLKAMRESELYNGMLNSEAIERLTSEFHFKGHLGDQDLFTLINMKYEWLFHILPCVWNRQLCVWWRDNGYKDVFSQYHTCEGDIKIWHGNCNTPIP